MENGIMADVYSAITTADAVTLERLAQVIELRAADSRQTVIRTEFLDSIPFPPAAKMLEIGCGTGAVCRAAVGRPDVAEVVGVDPSAAFLQRAREIAAGLSRLSFIEADGRDVPLPADTFDVVVFYTTLCHVPAPERALAEAMRLLKPGGWLAALDGDYAGTTVATAATDPLQACADAAMAALVNDAWLARRLSALVREMGFMEPRATSHGYVGIDDASYLLTLVDRGADSLAASGRIGAPLAEALKAEARRRTEAGSFFGSIAYFSLVARKPA
jgi:ubiquinone/menaquinone biosynthesis C-methylase UbiE